MDNDYKYAHYGANIFLQQKGIDINTLNNCASKEEKFEYAKHFVDKKEYNLIESIINEKYLPNESFKFNSFYETNERTAGDSAEWYRYFVQLGQGQNVEKEVHFDLKDYKGYKAEVLGEHDTINKDFRSSDIVIHADGKDIHQELKVGMWGSNLRGRIRDEVYADIIRLTKNPTDEQEYRIYTNAKTDKSLLNDKEQTKYLMKIAKMFPDRVRLYVNDQETSISEFGQKANLSDIEISSITDKVFNLTNDIIHNLSGNVIKSTLQMFLNAIGMFFKAIWITLKSIAKAMFFMVKYIIIGIFYVIKYLCIGIYKTFAFLFTHIKLFVAFIIVIAIIAGGLFLFNKCGDGNSISTSQKYTVTFDSNGGSKVNKQVIKKDNLIKEPNNPVKEGYAFAGWYCNNEKFDFNICQVVTNMTLVAKWECHIEYVIRNQKEVVITNYNVNSMTNDIVILEKYEGLPTVYIDDGAFFECTSLTSITIPNSVTSIGDCAFGYSDNLTTVTIPVSLTTIGYGAFYSSSIVTINYTGTQQQWSLIEMAGWGNENLEYPTENGITINYNYVIPNS